jgi:hypothetical protein
LRRLVPPVAVVLATALFAAAPAGTAGPSATAAQGTEPDIGIFFIALTRNGTPVKVTKFRYSNVLVRCAEGETVVSNTKKPLPSMKVSKKRFSGKVRTKTRRVRVAGRFKGGGKRVKGKLRVRGQFKDSAGATLTNCDSGRREWVAKSG